MDAAHASPARCCRWSSSRPPATGASAAGLGSSSTRVRCPIRTTPPRSCSRRYLAAFGPASRRDARRLGRRRRSATSRAALGATGRPSPTATSAARSCSTCPALPLPPASTQLPVRLLARWDQALLAYADRERIIPPEVAAAEAHAQRRPDGDRRRPGRGELAAAARDARSRRSKVDDARGPTPQGTGRRIRAEARRTARLLRARRRRSPSAASEGRCLAPRGVRTRDRENQRQCSSAPTSPPRGGPANAIERGRERGCARRSRSSTRTRGVEADGVLRRAGRRLPRGDRGSRRRRPADPRRLPAQPRARRPGDPRRRR